MSEKELVTDEIFKKQYDSIKDLNNKELREIIENSNWNFILQIIRYLEQENKDLKEKNEFLMKRDNKCQMLEQVIKKAMETINKLKTTGWVNGENGTTTGYTYAKPCCKTRLNIIEDILKEVE